MPEALPLRRGDRAIDLGPGKGHMVALSRDGAVAYVSKVGAGTVVRVGLADGSVLAGGDFTVANGRPALGTVLLDPVTGEVADEIAAHRDELVLDPTLVRDEEDVDLGQRRGRLGGHVLG